MTATDTPDARGIVKEIVAGNAFRDTLLSRADFTKGSAPLWHGWAIMDAFLAGIDWSRENSAATITALEAKLAEETARHAQWAEEIRAGIAEMRGERNDALTRLAKAQEALRPFAELLELDTSNENATWRDDQYFYGSHKVGGITYGDVRRAAALSDPAPAAGGQPLEKRPVAWRVKDFADGWIIFQDEAAAAREVEATGAIVQGLYARDGTAEPTPPSPEVAEAAQPEADMHCQYCGQWHSSILGTPCPPKPGQHPALRSLEAHYTAEVARLEDMKVRGDLTEDWGECSLVSAKLTLSEIQKHVAVDVPMTEAQPSPELIERVRDVLSGRLCITKDKAPDEACPRSARLCSCVTAIATFAETEIAAAVKAARAEATKFERALEDVALLDDADGHTLSEKDAFSAVAIATNTLGKHPSTIFHERLAAIRASGEPAIHTDESECKER